jgi:carboxypeptidase D
MFNTDVATGSVKVKTSAVKDCQVYATTGRDSVADIMNQLPVHGDSECYLWDIFETCTDVQAAMLRNGTAITKDYVMVGYKADNGTSVYY